MSPMRLVVTLAAAVVALAWTGGAGAVNPERVLAKFQPVLVFHPGEEFRPTTVETFVDDAALEAATGPGMWTTVDPEPTASTLPTASPPVWRLNQQPCFAGAPLGDLACYAASWADRPETAVYGRVVREGKALVLQYWLFYYDNLYRYPFLPLGAIWQSHEGDWEVVTVVLAPGRRPLLTGYSQHCSGETRPWGETPRVGRHPVVYVALGSHANYYQPGLHPFDRACLPAQVLAFFEQAGLPLPADMAAAGPAEPGLPLTLVGDGGERWIAYPGFWGELEYFNAPPPIGTVPFGASPVGPAFHAVWLEPLATLEGWR